MRGVNAGPIWILAVWNTGSERHVVVEAGGTCARLSGARINCVLTSTEATSVRSACVALKTLVAERETLEAHDRLDFFEDPVCVHSNKNTGIGGVCIDESLERCFVDVDENN